MLAQAHCEQLLACTCDDAPYPSVESCVEAVRGELEDIAEAARTAGHTYDGSCARQIIDDLRALGCNNEPPRRNAESCQRECFVYHGTSAVSELCDPPPSTYLMPTANCAQGLYCENHPGGQPYDTCEDPCVGKQVVGEGEDCGPDVATCAEGFWCSNFGCTPNASLGENCGFDEDTCQPGEVCDLYQDPSVCIAAIPEGGACLTGFANDCDPHQNLRCVDDQCVPQEPWICRRR